MSAPVLSADARTRIAGLADAIVPRSAEMPSASDVDLAGEPLDKALKARPDLVAMLERLPEREPQQAPAAYLDDTARSDAAAHDALLQAVLGAYYMHPEVKRRLGYHGQQALTLPRGGFGGEELIEQVMSSPPRYRRPVSG